MRILIATSEAVPFAKTGGLADVCGALPQSLAALGQQPMVIMPLYRQTRQSSQPIEHTGVKFDVRISGKTVSGAFYRGLLPDGVTPVYLVEQDSYFNRPELYGIDGKDYRDNCERFVFFCRAVMEAIRLLDLRPDVLHCNDWQTGLIPAFLKLEYRGVPDYENIGSLFTIHNLAYQGVFWHWDMLLTGLDWKYFNWQQMEFFGNLNLMKTGLVFADRLNTVSNRYAEEIQSAPLGCGLEGVLQTRRDLLSGIINGVDYHEWNPETDKYLTANYGVSSWSQSGPDGGKPACKAALQADLGLPIAAGTPLAGFVGRLVDQKGIDLLAAVMRDSLQSGQNLQWVVLGSGDLAYHDLFANLAKRHPQRFALRVQFSPELSHRIEAGADMFLMPSRYEPCGLNQLYSLKYGSVPVVRATGGLADTIIDATDENLAAGTANGFTFGDYSALALAEAVKRACDMYAKPKLWAKLVETGMRQDWSWDSSAQQYVNLYRRVSRPRPALV